MNLNDYKKSIDEIKNQNVEVVRSQNQSNYVSVKKNILLINNIIYIKHFSCC